jgi:hypothetical protein
VSPGSLSILMSRSKKHLSDRWNGVVVKVFGLGAGFGGVLTEQTRPHRDGSTHCPQCQGDFLEVTKIERWVRCHDCHWVFVQRRPEQLSETMRDLFKTPKQLVDQRRDGSTNGSLLPDERKRS